MADQQNISHILAALAAQRGTPGQAPPGQPGHGIISGGAFATPTVSGAKMDFAMPQPDNTGSLNLSGVKPVSTGSVSIAEAIAKARGIAAEKGISYDATKAVQQREADARAGSRSHRRSRSPSRSPSQVARDSFRDNYNPYRDERRNDQRGSNDRGFPRDRSFSPRPARRRNSPSPPPGRAYIGDDRSPSDPRGGADDNTETITIGSHLVGLIIGRQGENLRRVEADTGARVQFLNGPEVGASTRLCKISGSWTSRSNAKAELDRIINENGGSSRSGPGSLEGSGRGPPKPSGPPAPREGESSTHIMVPDKTVGLIIGRGGETIRDLQERSGCHINIVGGDKSVNGLRPVNLMGDEQSTQRARDLILEIVESDTRNAGNQAQREPMRGGFPARGGDFGSGERMNDTIFVPGEAVGMIIGKGGEAIREMQSVSGCKINVQPPSGREAEREIQLVGSRNAIEQAKQAIMDKVNNMNRPSGPRRDDDYSDRYSQTQQLYAQDSSQAAQLSPDGSDPYAAYGGYNNYVAMWYAAMGQQQQAGQAGAFDPSAPSGAL